MESVRIDRSQSEKRPCLQRHLAVLRELGVPVNAVAGRYIPYRFRARWVLTVGKNHSLPTFIHPVSFVRPAPLGSGTKGLER